MKKVLKRLAKAGAIHVFSVIATTAVVVWLSQPSGKTPSAQALAHRPRSPSGAPPL